MHCCTQKNVHWQLTYFVLKKYCGKCDINRFRTFQKPNTFVSYLHGNVRYWRCVSRVWCDVGLLSHYVRVVHVMIWHNRRSPDIKHWFSFAISSSEHEAPRGAARRRHTPNITRKWHFLWYTKSLKFCTIIRPGGTKYCIKFWTDVRFGLGGVGLNKVT